MPRIPIATFEDYEEPVTASEYPSQPPPHAAATTTTSTGKSNKRVPPLSSFQPDEAERKGVLSPLQNPHKPKAPPPPDASTSSLRLSKVQRAEEYPQITFKPRRELQAARQEGQAAERARIVSRRTRNFVFGLGSHGLCDPSTVRATPLDGEAEHATAGSVLPSLSAGEKHAAPASAVTNTTSTAAAAARSKAGSRHHTQREKESTLPALPAISAATKQTTKGRQPLSAPVSLPQAGRTLRCGGVIDTFSYFSVHRVYPELYAG